MIERRRAKSPIKPGLRNGLSPRAKAVMRAFRAAKFVAPGFVLSCGVFPEVSEAATDRLHSIVHDLAERRLGKAQQMKALRRWVGELVGQASTGHRGKEAVDHIETELTALLSIEATAAYLFGVAVGLAVQSLPERLGR